jgi:hypothetical protein
MSYRMYGNDDSGGDDSFLSNQESFFLNNSEALLNDDDELNDYDDKNDETFGGIEDSSMYCSLSTLIVLTMCVVGGADWEKQDIVSKSEQVQHMLKPPSFFNESDEEDEDDDFLVCLFFFNINAD